MKNIIEIIKNDFSKLTKSVVVLVIIMGLCIIPCLYAWFNIFSNWDPYEKEATSRIQVAVASEDKGAKALDLYINIGEKITDALGSNKDIGWVFVKDKDSAIKGVNSGKYYAALVIPKDFSANALSFTDGKLDNPDLEYFENEKKNAIAPKITGKAKIAVTEEINKAFIETIAKYASEATKVADSVGLNPNALFEDLGDRMSLLSESLEDSVITINAVSSLSDVSNDLLKVSDNLIEDAENTIKNGEKIFDNNTKKLPRKKNSSATKVVKEEISILSNDLKEINNDLLNIKDDKDAYNEFYNKKLEKRIELINNMKESTDKIANSLFQLGFDSLAKGFEKLSDKLDTLSNKLKKLEKADDSNWPEISKNIKSIIDDVDSIMKELKETKNNVNSNLDSKLDNAISNARKAIKGVNSSLSSTYGNLDNLSRVLKSYENTLNSLQGNLDDTVSNINSISKGLDTLSGLFNSIANSKAFKDVNILTTDDSEVIASYFTSPVKMKTETIYPVENYGSAMAAFYTVLAQWVGALLTAVLIKTKVKKDKNYKTYEKFFGRYGVFLFIGLAQGLIVSLVDLLYIGIQCPHPVYFVLAACINGICFTMINYALVFALDNIGLAMAVLILVMQVAGSGGTYPVEVLPTVFQKIYPFLPFGYSLGAMKECIFGMYKYAYIKDIGVLLLFAIGFCIFGLLLYKPALKLNGLIDNSKKEINKNI